MASAFTLWGEIRADTSSFQTQILAAEARLKALKGEIDATEAKAQTLGQTTATSGRQFQKLNDTVDQHRQKLGDLANQYQKGEMSSKQMAAGLGSVDTAANRLNSRLADHNARLADLAAKQSNVLNQTGKLGSSFTQLGQTLSMSLTLPIVGISTASAKMAVDFQQQMTYIRTQAGDTEDSIAQLSGQVLNLAHASQYGPEELAKGLYHLTSLGLRGAEAMQVLDTSQKLAAVGGAKLEETTSALGAAIVTGIKGTQDYSAAAGTLNAIVGSGNMRMDQLVSALGTGVLPVMKLAGLSLRDFGAALATMTDNAIGADEASTRLKQTIAMMESPTPKATKALKELGMSADQLAMDMRQKGLIPALQDLKTHLLETYGTTEEGQTRMSTALDHIFSVRSGAAMKLLIDQLDRVQQKFDQIGEKSGTFAEAYSEQQQTAMAKIKTAWSGIQADAISIGEKILPILGTAFTAIAQVIRTLVDGFNSLSAPLQTVVGIFLGLAAAVGPVLLVIGGIATFIATAAEAFGSLAAIAPVLAAVAAGIALIGATVAAMYALWTTDFGGIQELTAQVAAGISSLWTQTMAMMSDTVKNALDLMTAFWINNGADIMKALSTVSNNITALWQSTAAFWSENGDAIMTTTRAVWTAVSGIILGVLRVVMDGIKIVAAVINGDWSKVWDAAVDIVKAVLSTIGSVMSGFGSVLVGIFKTIWGSIWALHNWIVAKATELGSALGEGLNAGILAASASVANSVKSMIQAAVISPALSILQINSPSKVFMAIGKGVGEGFIDGINAMRSSVHAAMASMLDLTNIPGLKLGKGDAGGVEMLTNLISEIAQANVETKLQSVLIELTASKYAGLNAAVRDRIELAAREIDRLKAINEGQAQFNQLYSDLLKDIIPEKTNLEKFNEAIAGPQVQTWLASINQQLARRLVLMGELAAREKDAGDQPGIGIGMERPTGDGVGLPTPGPDKSPDGIPPPPPKLSWDNFWKMMTDQLGKYKASLPSLKAVIGENLVNSIGRIGDIFANAAAHWDGTLKGFFKSVGMGFVQMGEQILAEITKLMVMKFVTQLIGMFLGSSWGGASTGVQDVGVGTWDSGAWGFADGGFTGTGSSTDPAGIVHRNEFVNDAATTRYFGPGFFERLKGMARSGVAPQMAFAGGGGGSFSGGSSSNSVTNSHTFHIHVSGGGNAQQTAQSVKQGIRQAMQMQQREQQRNK